MPLLFETNAKAFQEVVVVACPRDIQLMRLMERNKLSKEDASAGSALTAIDQKVKRRRT